MEALCLVSNTATLPGASHTIAENIMKPCALDLVNTELNEECAQKMESVSLSNKTVCHPIDDMTKDVKSVPCSRLQS
jgi:hypothetical protein